MAAKGKSRCDAHAWTEDRWRGSANDRGYTSRWRAAAKRFLSVHKLCECEECRAGDGRFTLATVVDHRIPHRGNQDLFWDENNWQAMAKQCHDRKTMRELNDTRG